MQFNSTLYDNNLHKNCTAPPEKGADMQLSCYLYSGHGVAFQYSDYNYKTLTYMALRKKSFILTTVVIKLIKFITVPECEQFDCHEFVLTLLHNMIMLLSCW